MLTRQPDATIHIDRVYVDRVYSRATKRQGTNRHEITVHRFEDATERLSLDTVSDWMASLCERALAASLPVVVTWHESAYGYDLISVAVDA